VATGEPDELSPLRPREFFGRPWAGEGEWIPRPWLRWLPGPRRLRFRSTASWLSDDLWLVHDETTWEDGRVERRDGVAKLVAPDRVRMTYDDMPGGTELSLHAEGFTLAPYSMAIAPPGLPVRILLRCVDRCHLEPGGELVDVIDISLGRLRLGRQVMRLRRE
jgi:hypothetical protein